MTAKEGLDFEVSWLCDIYGKPAVEAAIKRQKGKRGRRTIYDHDRMASFYRQDARDWLDGRDPMELRKNNSIARGFARANPEGMTTEDSITSRIVRNLKRNRYQLMLHVAITIAQNEYPYSTYLTTLATLADLQEDESRPYYLECLEHAKALVDWMPADFSESTTFAQIRMQPEQALGGVPKPKGYYVVGDMWSKVTS